jgi:hypothetical protein
MKRLEAIMKMKGADIKTAPLKVENELIFPWDINFDFSDFSNEQIEEFYDVEVEDEKAK